LELEGPQRAKTVLKSKKSKLEELYFSIAKLIKKL
jgi:hypothetical protein